MTLAEAYTGIIEPCFIKALEEDLDTDVEVKVYSNDGKLVLDNYALTVLNTYCRLEVNQVSTVKWFPEEKLVKAVVYLEDDADDVFRFIEGRNRTKW